MQSMIALAWGIARETGRHMQGSLPVKAWTVLLLVDQEKAVGTRVLLQWVTLWAHKQQQVIRPEARPVTARVLSDLHCRRAG